MEEEQNINEAKADETEKTVVVEGDSVEENKNASNWFDGISDESLRSNPNVTKHASVEALAKSYVELSKKLGAKGLAPLPEDATPEVIEARKVLKRGENIKSANDYSRKLSNDESEEIGGVDYAKNISQMLFDAGCDDETHTAVMNAFVNSERERVANTRKEIENCENLLKDEWNEDFDVQMKANEIFVSKHFPEVHEQLLKNGGYKVPAIAKMFKQLNEMTKDGEVRIQKAAAQNFDEQLKEIESSKAYQNPWDEGHKAAVSRRTDIIMKMAEKR